MPGIDKCKEILGLDPHETYSDKEYKKAYHNLATQYHPDKEGGDEEKFKEVKEAYEILTGKQRPPPRQEFHRNPGYDPFMDMRDFFHKMNQARRRSARPPSAEEEVVCTIRTTIGKLKEGQRFTVNYQLSEDCPDCNGDGAKSRKVCYDCRGNGSFTRAVNHGNGGMYLSQDMCTTCSGKGEIIEDPCNTCDAHGYVIHSKTFKGEVKERE